MTDISGTEPVDKDRKSGRLSSRVHPFTDPKIRAIVEEAMAPRPTDANCGATGSDTHDGAGDQT